MVVSSNQSTNNDGKKYNRMENCENREFLDIVRKQLLWTSYWEYATDTLNTLDTDGWGEHSAIQNMQTFSLLYYNSQVNVN